MVDNNIPSIYTNLKNKIESNITSNNANEITGKILREVLLEMVNNSIDIIKIIDNQQIVIIKGEGENSAALEGKDTIIFDGEPIPNHEKYASHAYSDYSIALGQNNISGINNDINTPLHQIGDLYQIPADIKRSDFKFLYFRNITADLFEKIQINSTVYLFSTTSDNVNICSKLVVTYKDVDGNFIGLNEDIIGTPKFLVFLEPNEKIESNQIFGYEYSEGYYNDIIGFASHIEGSYNSHVGINSHIEGSNNISNGNYTHTEGYKNEISGEHNHIEGYINKNEGNYNHIEGSENKNEGNYNHVEGYNNISNTNYAHIEGKSNQVFGEVAHAEGIETIATGEGSHTEGYLTKAEGNYSHAEGNSTTASGISSHTEGNSTSAEGNYSHAEGNTTTASGISSHAEGNTTIASGISSHAEGIETIATGEASHVEGYKTYAEQNYSHAEGQNTKAIGVASHTEGSSTEAQGDYSHAGGNDSVASSKGSFVHGNNLIVSNEYEVSFGQYNETIEESTLFSIGIGTDNENRKNAFEVRNVNGTSLIFVDGDPIETSISIFMPISYTDLLTLLNDGQLRPGQQYRIVDYVTTTSQPNTSSLEIPFDIIVTADSETQLSEIARATNHNEDTYFSNQKLSSWELKYCIDNDTSRFSWADTENGKGVIYYMKDEYENEAPYDFKNIKFDTYFTFSRINDSDNEIVDASLNTEGICKLNRIDTYINLENKQALNNNIFIITVKDCISNIIEKQCSNNEFKNALGIHVNQYCSNISFKSNNEKYILEGLEIDPYIIPNEIININDFYFNKNEIPVLKNNCKVFLENNIPVIGLKDKVIKITYNEINVLINNSELIIGQEYLITDYYVVIPDTNEDIIGLTSNNYFDILTFAIDKKTLSENVKLVKKEDSQSNFNFNHFDAKYCINNDIEKYDWVDDENSKGVIYYMKDEYGNEAPYDFLNIRLNYQNFENGVYTFTYINEDGILNSHDGIDFIKNNIIKSYIKDGKYSIPFNIIFASTISECNTFGYNSHHNVIFDNSRYNDFGESCSYNQLGSNCVYNKFEDNCTDIRFIKIEETDNPTNNDSDNTSDILPKDYERLINEPPCENCNYNVINAGSKYLRIYIIDNPNIEKIIQNIKIDDNITGNIKDSENVEYRYIQLIDSQNLDIILLDENSIAFINKGERERQIVKLEEEIIMLNEETKNLKEIIESIINKYPI